MDTQSFCVDEEKRLDKILSEQFPGYSRTYFQYLIENQSVTLNGKPVKKRHIPKKGDEVTVFFLLSPEIDLRPENIPLDILYEDDSIICINKPAGMVVHPAPGHPSGTFVNALLHHCQQLPTVGDENRPGIVHRLDKDTSGVLVAAKTIQAHQRLITLFSERKIQKEYLTVCIGHPGDRTIDAPIGRHPKCRKEMIVKPEGKEAVTEIETLKKGDLFSLIRAKPVTGRTHQIRIHLKSIGFPILGDKTYGSLKMNQKLGATRQLLHAYRIIFPHPCKDKILNLIAPPPNDLQNWIEWFES